MTIYSLDVLLSRFGTSLLFYVQYLLFLLDLHPDFSGGSSGGLVFASLVVIRIVKGFGVVSKAEVDVSLVLSCFFDNPTDVGNLISGSSSFLNPAWTSGSSHLIYCWSLAWRILSINLLTCEMSAMSVSLCGRLNILWHCLSLGLEWKLIFSSPMATAEFS